MLANEDERVPEALWEMAARYPNSKFDEVHENAYLDELGGIASDAVLRAIKDAPSESPQWIPTAPMLRVMAKREEVRLKSQSAQRSFEQLTQEKEKPVTHDEALQEFYAKCDEALTKDLGHEITDDNKHLFFGILAILGKVYGFKSTLITGNHRSTDPRERIGYARGYIWAWRQEHFMPHQVIRALRAAPATFERFPTEGMIRAVIKDEPLNLFPPGWVRPDAGGAKGDTDAV